MHLFLLSAMHLFLLPADPFYGLPLFYSLPSPRMLRRMSCQETKKAATR